jgi:hypothetical protein
VVLADADSAAALLARVDTTRLTTSSQMLYDLLRAIVYEERWYLRHADTTVCLTSDAETWNFNRQSDDRKSDDVLTPDDSSRLRVFHYYEELSLGGTTDDEDALRRFGRACFVLSRRQNDSILPMQTAQFFHLAIHCAEATATTPLRASAPARHTTWTETGTLEPPTTSPCPSTSRNACASPPSREPTTARAQTSSA